MSTGTNITLVTRAPGKLVLFGEYSVLSGFPAIVLAVDRMLTCHATQLTQEDTGPEASQLSFDNTQPIQRFVLEEATTRGLKHPLSSAGHKVSFVFNSSSFVAPTTPSVKLGLGSSAAAAVAFAAQFTQSKDQCFELALAAHQRFMRGLGSGIDVAASTWGGLLRIQKSDSGHLARATIPTQHITPYLVPVFTGQSANTRNHLEALADAQAKHPAKINSILGQLGACARNLSELVEANGFSQPSGFQEALKHIDATQTLLETLGDALSLPIVSPVHHRIKAIAQCFGGTAKPSGSGGGDTALCFVAPEAIEPLRNALKREGLYCPQLEVCTDGIGIMLHNADDL